MKKAFLAAVVIVGATLIGGVAAAQRTELPVVEVYKSPSCGCCGNWVKHLEANGFRTKVTNTDDIDQVKTRMNVPGKVQSCHTAVVDGYVIEGHVPAAEVKRLLKERPAILGVAVPGMPIGSPGMEVGDRVQPYNVVSFDKQGQTRVFASYGK